MDIYGINNISEVSKSLEVLEAKLERIKRIEYNLEIVDFSNSCIKDLIFNFKIPEDLFIDFDRWAIEDILRSLKQKGYKSIKTPFFALLKRRIMRRIERIRRKINKIFFDYRVQIRSFVNKVIRRNTEEEIDYVVSENINKISLLLIHINNLWTKKLYWIL